MWKDFNEPIALSSSKGMNNPIIVVKGNSYSGQKKIETCLQRVLQADVRVLCGNGVTTVPFNNCASKLNMPVYKTNRILNVSRNRKKLFSENPADFKNTKSQDPDGTLP